MYFSANFQKPCNIKRSEVTLPIIDIVTGRKIGEASESEIIKPFSVTDPHGSRRMKNDRSMIKMGPRYLSATYQGDRIEIDPMTYPFPH